MENITPHLLPYIPFLISFISIFINLLYWAILIHVIMSWFATGRTAFGDLLDQVVRPVLAPFRWARIGMIDLSPIVALILLSFLGKAAQNFLVSLL